MRTTKARYASKYAPFMIITDNKPYQANRTLGVISKMMNLAEAWGLRPDRSNPCYHVRKYRETKRERFLTVEELARLGRALDEEQSLAPSAVTAFRLLLYTGARLSEIQTLKWEHIRGDRIHLPDSKTGLFFCTHPEHAPGYAVAP